MNTTNDASADESRTQNETSDAEDGRGQGIQINENTIDDPHPPEVPDNGLHSRRDVTKQDQGIQINDNTIADKQ